LIPLESGAPSNASVSDIPRSPCPPGLSYPL
jgi:hypothetical protein